MTDLLGTVEREANPAELVTCSFVEHAGMRVVAITLDSGDGSRIVESIDKMFDILAREPDHSVLLLLDITRGVISREGGERWIHHLPLLDRKVLRGAVVCTGLKRVGAMTVLMAARIRGMDLMERLVLVETNEEALVCLAANPV